MYSANAFRSACVLLLCTLLSACIAPGGSVSDKRDHVQRMRTEVLAELYKLKPEARQVVSSAPGYAVFSNKNVNVIFLSGSSGYGVVVDNATGHSTYMQMAEAGVGLGLGVKDFRAVFVFTQKHIMDRFIDQGWQFGGHADAAAKASDMGAAVGGEVLLDGIRVYQITEAGLALQATVKGTKYWQNSELN